MVSKAGSCTGEVGDDSEYDAYEEDVEVYVEPSAEIMIDAVNHGIENACGKNSITSHKW